MKIKDNKALGRKGEKLAARYLKRSGYKILDKNYTCAHGEVDIIARDGEELVFVEVKTRRPGASVSGVYSVTRNKREHIMRAAACYTAEKGSGYQPRFDVVEVSLDPDTGRLTDIEHIKSAFIQAKGYARY